MEREPLRSLTGVLPERRPSKLVPGLPEPRPSKLGPCLACSNAGLPGTGNCTAGHRIASTGGSFGEDHESFSMLLRRLAEAHERELQCAQARSRDCSKAEYGGCNRADYDDCNKECVDSPIKPLRSEATPKMLIPPPPASELVALLPSVPGCVEDTEGEAPSAFRGIRVFIEGAANLRRATDPPEFAGTWCEGRGLDSYCACMLPGSEERQFQTAVVSGPDPVWECQGDVLDFSPGGELDFKVFDSNDSSICWGRLGYHHLKNGCFEGDIPLLGGETDDASLKLKVKRCDQEDKDKPPSGIPDGQGQTDSVVEKQFPMRTQWLSEGSQHLLFKERSSRNPAAMTKPMEAETVLLNRSESCLQRLIFFPGSHARLSWDCMGAVLIMYDTIVIPMVVFDPPETTLRTIMDLSILIFWTLNMVASVMVGYVKDGVTEMRPGRVIRHYLQTWFLIDLIVVAPDWYFTMQSLGTSKSGAESSVKLLRILRLVRCVRLVRLVKLRWIVASLNDMLISEHSNILANIVKMILKLCFINHFIACTFYLLGDLQKDSESTWIEEHGFSGANWEYKYLTAFHWSITQFTPASMHVQPQNAIERTFTIGVVVFALVGFSYLVGSITNSLTQLRSMSEDTTKQFWMLRRYLKHNHVSTVLSVRIQRYLEHAWQRQKTRPEEPKIFALLSEQLSNELKCARFLPHMKVHPLFECLYETSYITLQRLAVNSVDWRNLARGDHLFFPNEVATHLYFVAEGKLHYAKIDSNGQESFEDVDGAEDWIAEPVLWTPHWVHLGSLVACSEADLVLINGEHFGTIVRLNPAVWQLVTGYARRFMQWMNQTPHSQLSDISQGEDISETLQGFLEESTVERRFSKKSAALADPGLETNALGSRLSSFRPIFSA